MIAAQEPGLDSRSIRQVQQQVDHARRVGAPVDIVAEPHDDGLHAGVGVPLGRFEQRLKQIGAAVNIPDGIERHALGRARADRSAEPPTQGLQKARDHD